MLSFLKGRDCQPAAGVPPGAVVAVHGLRGSDLRAHAAASGQQERPQVCNCKFEFPEQAAIIFPDLLQRSRGDDLEDGIRHQRADVARHRSARGGHMRKGRSDSYEYLLGLPKVCLLDFCDFRKSH